MRHIIKNAVATILIFFFAMQINVYAQVTEMEEVIYLKNGSVIHGVIIEQVPNLSVKIQTYDGNIFVYKMDEIAKITKESTLKTSTNRKDDYKTVLNKNSEKRNSNFQPHYEFMAEGGYFLGIGNYSAPPIFPSNNPFGNYGEPDVVKNIESGYSLRTIHSYAISESFLLGAGIGVDIYKAISLLPLTIEGQLNLGKSNTRPYLNVAFGHSVALNADAGGATFKAGFGVKQGASWAFNFSYRLQSSAIGYYKQGTLYEYVGTGKYLAISSSYFF